MADTFKIDHAASEVEARYDAETGNMYVTHRFTFQPPPYEASIRKRGFSWEAACEPVYGYKFSVVAGDASEALRLLGEQVAAFWKKRMSGG